MSTPGIPGATEMALPQGDASIPVQSYPGTGISGPFGDIVQPPVPMTDSLFCREWGCCGGHLKAQLAAESS